MTNTHVAGYERWSLARGKGIPAKRFSDFLGWVTPAQPLHVQYWNTLCASLQKHRDLMYKAIFSRSPLWWLNKEMQSE